MDKLTPAQKLDLVLNEMNVNSNKGWRNTDSIYYSVNEIKDTRIDKPKYFNPVEFTRIIKKLDKDGFVECEMQGTPVHSQQRDYKYPHYKITFEGETLLDLEGGYSGRLTSQNKEKVEVDKQRILQMRLQTKLNRLTFWIAIGTVIAAIYYLNELYLKGWFH